MDDQMVSTDIVSPNNDQLSDVAHALGLEMHSDIHKNQNALERLVEWAQMKGAKDSSEIISHIKELAGTVGSNPLGGNMAKHLSTYAYLEMERARIDRELSKMDKK